MNEGKKISNAEWLCAFMIDLLPISLLNVFLNVILITFLTFEIGTIQEAIRTISITTALLVFPYLLLKDAFGGGLGNKIVGITVSKNGEKPSFFISILRNFLLAICFVLPPFLSSWTNNNFLIINTLFFFIAVELVCVRLTNKTIGDAICRTELDRSENYVPNKINNRTLCITTIIIIFTFTKNFFTPNFHLSPTSTSLSQLILSQNFIVPTLVVSLIYSYLLYKLIKPVAFRWAAILILLLLRLAVFALYFYNKQL